MGEEAAVAAVEPVVVVVQEPAAVEREVQGQRLVRPAVQREALERVPVARRALGSRQVQPAQAELEVKALQMQRVVVILLRPAQTRLGLPIRRVQEEERQAGVDRRQAPRRMANLVRLAVQCHQDQALVLETR